MAVTMVGDARKFMVLTFPSFLERKFRLKDVRIAKKGLSGWSSGEANTHHFLLPSCPRASTGFGVSNYYGCYVNTSQTCPIHGPHALANTVAPVSSRSSVTLSRSIVALICSEPGVQRKGT